MTAGTGPGRPGTGAGRDQGGGAGRVAVLGVRHHGPGSARSVVRELDRLQPDMLLIEGPADAAGVLALAADPGMAPPVALLAYAPDEPRRSAFWPFAVFSPEWQALTWAAAHRVPARFCDLPASAMLAEEEATGQPGGESEPAGQAAVTRPRGDPIALLAAAAGYDDPERWWDHVIECRVDGQSPFGTLTDAMAELRADASSGPAREEAPARDAPPGKAPAGKDALGEAAPGQPLPGGGPPGERPRGEDLRERRREAHMRQAVRAALKETAGTVAVVCGAWHAPALSGKLPPASADAELLRGIGKRKAVLTWVPWTHSRLAAASGYGAGITSPGWYHHLFTTPDQVVVRWLAKVARVLREHDLPVSTAHIIEAARLADALAALRARPLAGLAEVSEATKSVMCDGDEFAAGFVTQDLVVGEQLGEVPESAPAVPLDADLRAQARARRLKIEALERTLALDLRQDTDRGRSVLLHRLTLLGIDWGAVTQDRVRGTGTFHETWTLCWRPELAVAIVDAARWGTTVVTAATAKIINEARSAADLAAVTGSVESALLADLPGALGPVLRALDSRAAADTGVAQLMAAVPALVRAVRYGDVRGTGTASLSAVIDALTARVCAGLPAAVTSLADDAAEQLRAGVDGMQAALALHAHDVRGKAAYDQWIAELTALAQRRDVHGLLAGRVVRLLTDTGVLSADEAARRLQACLSIGIPAADKAAWAEGFLSGGGLLLVHDRNLLAVLDDWVATLPGQDFTDVLPLLRRTFAEYTGPERASIGTAARNLGSGAPPEAEPDQDVDATRAAGALRTVAAILGGAR